MAVSKMVRWLIDACPVSLCGYYSTFARFFKPESLIFPERGIAPFFRPLRLNLLAPEIVHAALKGRLPNGVGVETLRQTLSVLWSDQKKQLGME